MPNLKLTYRKTFYGDEDSQKILFFFCAYATKHWMYKSFFKKFLKQGVAIYAFDFPIKSWNGIVYDEMVNLVDSVLEDAHAEITRLVLDNPQRIFYSYGVSVGSVMAVRLAKESKHIQKVVLNTVYGSSSKQIWDHKALGWTRQNLEDSGKDWKKLSEDTARIEPYKNVERLRGKEILIFYSVGDKSHLPDNTELLLQSLDKHEIPYALVKDLKKGHKSFIVNNLRRGKTDEFLLKT